MNQMSCDEAKTLLPLYIDDMLSDEEKEELLTHLSACQECEKELAFFRSMMQTTKELPEIEVSESLGASLSAAIRAVDDEIKELVEEKEKDGKVMRIRINRWHGYQSALVAAAVVAFLAVSVVLAPKTSHFIYRSNVPYVQQKEEVQATPEPTPAIVADAQAASTRHTGPATQSGKEWADVSGIESEPQRNRGPQIRQAGEDTGKAKDTQTHHPVATSVETKSQLIASFSFDPQHVSAAKQLLAGLPRQNGMYVVGASEFDTYRGKLEELEGFVSYQTQRIDLTQEYLDYLNQADAKQMAAIDFKNQHSYIRIQ